jgi:hypothetical protein
MQPSMKKSTVSTVPKEIFQGQLQHASNGGVGEKARAYGSSVRFYGDFLFIGFVGPAAQ